MPELVDIAGLDTAKVLVALHAQAQVLPEAEELAERLKTKKRKWDLTGSLELDEAELLLTSTQTFGVLGGRLLMVDLEGDNSNDETQEAWLDPIGYDLANGEGTAAKAISELHGSPTSAEAPDQTGRKFRSPRHCIDTLLEAYYGLDVPASSARLLDTFSVWRTAKGMKKWWREPNSELDDVSPNWFANWDQTHRVAGQSDSKTRTDSEKKILLALVHKVLGPIG